MKAETAAKKLGVLLEATPEDFRSGPVTRTTLNELLESPPEWLTELRRTGPHPRPVVAAKLGVSIAGLRRGGVEEPLTSEQIQELLKAHPQARWHRWEPAGAHQTRAAAVRAYERCVLVGPSHKMVPMASGRSGSQSARHRVRSTFERWMPSSHSACGPIRASTGSSPRRSASM